MKKNNFISLVMGTMGGLLFGVGLCMCLLPEWGAFRPGIVVAGVGLVVLLAMLLVRRRMAGKPAIRLNAKAIGTVLFGVLGTLVLGVGMCMTMVWEGLLLPGIAVGVVGIFALLLLIPMCRGLH